MLLGIIPELVFDFGGVVLVGDVHDDSDPRKDVVGFLGEGRTHRARASGCPTLLDGRRRGDPLLLDDALHLLDIVDVSEGGLVDGPGREAVLQDPLGAAALEPQDLGAVGDALACRAPPEFGLRAVHLRDMLRVQGVEPEQLFPQLGEVVALQTSAVRVELPQQVPQRPDPLLLGHRRLRHRALLGHVGDHDDDGVGVRDPHVPHMAEGLQQVGMVLPQVRRVRAECALMQRVPRDALERHL
mmetsp:Transcript_30261/g.60236  ORF Transcript_30261/g.60236 Transcript_30261/m.60236 type:complete len:242 (-) Transcript_30261:715-1440(-)